MKTALIARNALLAALLVPMFATAGIVGMTETASAQVGAAAGPNNSGGPGPGAPDPGPSNPDSTSAIDIACIAAPCDPPRRPPRTPVPVPVSSVSTAPDCSCEIRTMKVGGQFVQVKDCYKIVLNTLRYCEPRAQ